MWIISHNGTCTIGLIGCTPPTVNAQGGGRGFAWIRIPGAIIYSCYITPNCTLDEYHTFLEGLEWSFRLSAPLKMPFWLRATSMSINRSGDQPHRVKKARPVRCLLQDRGYRKPTPESCRPSQGRTHSQ